MTSDLFFSLQSYERSKDKIWQLSQNAANCSIGLMDMRKFLLFVIALACLSVGVRQMGWTSLPTPPHPPAQSELFAKLEAAVLFCEAAQFDSARWILDDIAPYFSNPVIPMDDSLLARWWNAQAYLSIENGDIQASLDFLHQSRIIFERNPQRFIRQIFFNANNLGRRYIMLNELDSAELYLRKAYSVLPSLPPSDIDSATLGMLYNNLGTVFYYKGGMDSALYYYDKFRVLAVMQKGQRSRDAARALYNIGLVREAMGYFKDAHLHFQQVLSVYEETLDANHPLIAEVYGALGYVHFRRHEWDRALYYYQKDLSISTLKRGPNHPDRALGLRNLAEVYQAKGHVKVAKEHYEAALEILQRAYQGRPHLDIALLHRMLIATASSPEEAVAHAKKAVEMELAVHPNPSISLADAYLKLGQSMLKANDPFGAAEVSDTLFSICKQVFPDQTDGTYVGAYYLRSKIERTLGHWELAFTYLDKGLDICSASATAAGVALEQEMLSGFIAKSRLYLDYYQATKDAAYLEAAISQVLQAVPLVRAIQMESTSEEASAVLDKEFRDLYVLGLDASVKLWQLQGKKQHFDRAFYFSELLKNKTLSESIRTLDNYKLANIPESTLRREYQLKKDIRYYRSLLEEEDPFISKQQILSTLSNLYAQQERFNANLKKFHPQYYRMKYAFEPVRRKHLQDKVLQEGQALVEFQVVDTLLACFSITKDKQSLLLIPLRDIFVHNAAASLLQEILNTQVRELIMIPEPGLDLPPLESWPLKGEILLKRFSVIYNSSATLYARKKPEDRILSRNILAFAPVDFSSHQLPLLGNSEQELKEIHRHLKVVPYVKEQATAETFLKELTKYSVIHLATHAEMRKDVPLKSVLYFYPEDTSSKGFLYAHQLFGIPMRAQLVTLSACYTSDSTNVLEGAQGIAAAFAYNGCSNILMSLREVEDKASMKIVSGFYKYLAAGIGKAEALRRAKLDYLAAADRYKQDQLYWSGIVLQGDFEPFDLGQPKWAVRWWVPAILLMLIATLYSRKWWVRLRV
jgi:tetratricopeptide (TPR) repeat protein